MIKNLFDNPLYSSRFLLSVIWLGNFALLFGCSASLSREPSSNVQACIDTIGPPVVDKVEVRDLIASEGEYDILRVDAANGAHMFVYFDFGSEAVARSRAACLEHQINLLQLHLGDTRTSAEWASVVFTTDPDYSPPRGEGIKTRWVVLVSSSPSGAINLDRMVLSSIPHEQVHDFQARNGARLPRWISEGHANWVGHHVTSALDPGEGKRQRLNMLDSLSRSEGPINLVGWKKVRPKREAIMRQVSANDRARMEADPDYFPSGSFQFTQDDFEGDETNQPARYAAAFLVFEGLEERHGANAVRNWMHELSSKHGVVSREDVAQTAKRAFNEDIDILLAEPK